MIIVQHLKGIIYAVVGISISAFPLGYIAYVTYNILPEESTQVSRYCEIRNELWKEKETVAHFPEKIPGDAQNVRLSYFSGFLQGTPWFQVKMKLPEGRINKLFQEFNSKKIKSFQGGAMGEHLHSENGVPTTYFHTGDSNDGDFDDFPDDFVVMVLGNKGYWNYGVAISKLRNEIVYWADYFSG